MHAQQLFPSFQARECPECAKMGTETFLELYQINLTEAIYMCPIRECKYPNGYQISYINRPMSIDGIGDDIDSGDDSNDVPELPSAEKKLNILSNEPVHVPKKEIERMVEVGEVVTEIGNSKPAKNDNVITCNVSVYNPVNGHIEKLSLDQTVSPRALETMNKLVDVNKKAKICFINNKNDLPRLKPGAKNGKRVRLTQEQLSSSISAALSATKGAETISRSSSRASQFEGFNFESNASCKKSKKTVKSTEFQTPIDKYFENITDDDILQKRKADLKTEPEIIVEKEKKETNENIDDNVLNEVINDIGKNKDANFDVGDVDDWLISLIA